MNIKMPMMLDTSKWELIPDFAKVSPRPLLVITKATEGGNITDTTFVKYWNDLAQDGIARGCYHFHRKAVAAAANAAVFLAALKTVTVNPKDIFVLDVEEEGTSAAAVIAWIDIIEKEYGNKIMIYSRANILNAITMNDTQRARLKKYPVWTAGYPTYPDNFASVPSGYIPNPNNWGPVWAWQYSDKGAVQGIDGAVDLNWMSPALIEYVGESNAPEPFSLTEAMWNGMMDRLVEMTGYLKVIANPSTPPPPPTPDPVVDDGYRGKVLGLYKVVQTENPSISFTKLMDSWGGQDTVIMNNMVKWMQVNCPGWDDFVNGNSPSVTFDGSLWHINLKAYKGQVVRVAEIVNGRARIIGLDSEGDPMACATNLSVVSPTKTPWYFHKVPNVPRYYPIVNPRHPRKDVLQASWISASYLEKA